MTEYVAVYVRIYDSFTVPLTTYNTYSYSNRILAPKVYELKRRLWSTRKLSPSTWIFQKIPKVNVLSKSFTHVLHSIWINYTTILPNFQLFFLSLTPSSPLLKMLFASNSIKFQCEGTLHSRPFFRHHDID